MLELTSASAISSLQNYSYVIIAVLMFFEGPIINSLASFAASLGYFNIYIIWLLAFCADLAADVGYYCIGRFGIHIFKRKWSHVRNPALTNIKDKIIRHPVKTIVSLKLIPFLVGPGLIAIGSSRMNFSKYMKISALTVIPITLFFTLGGFYLGIAFANLYNVVNKTLAIIVFLAIIIFVLPYLFKLLMRKYIAVEDLKLR